MITMYDMEKEKTKEKLVRVTAWIPQKKLRSLMALKKDKHSQSEILRFLIDEELERMRSWKAHKKLYGVASASDFNDRLL